jgi:hypothetical protein
MERALLALLLWSLRLLGAVEQARLLDDIGEQHEHSLIGTQDFAHQHEAQ